MNGDSHVPDAHPLWAFGNQQEVTKTLLLRCNAPIEMVVDVSMKPTICMRARASRFLSNRYAYRERPNYLPELVVFGMIVITATVPIFSLAKAMAMLR